MQYRILLESRYKATIAQVDEMLAIYRFLDTNSEIPVKDNLLRASLTMLVSAIDTTIHELVISAIMIELREQKSIFKINKFNINISCIFENETNVQFNLVELDLRKQFTKSSFQSSRQIETVLSSIGISKIWNRLTSKFNDTSDNIKRKLDLMVRRRNKIVHEGDLDSFHCLQPIDEVTIKELYKFTNLFIIGIFDEFDSILKQHNEY